MPIGGDREVFADWRCDPGTGQKRQLVAAEELAGVAPYGADVANRQPVFRRGWARSAVDAYQEQQKAGGA